MKKIEILEKLFEIHNEYWKNNKPHSSCTGCFYARACSCSERIERIPLCIESLKRNTGKDYSYLLEA